MDSSERWKWVSNMFHEKKAFNTNCYWLQPRYKGKGKNRKIEFNHKLTHAILFYLVIRHETGTLFKMLPVCRVLLSSFVLIANLYLSHNFNTFQRVIGLSKIAACSINGDASHACLMIYAINILISMITWCNILTCSWGHPYLQSTLQVNKIIYLWITDKKW